MMAKAFDQRKKELLEHLQCTICHESVDDTRSCMYCSQIFCNKCITNWLQRKSDTCPHCRRTMYYCKLTEGKKINQIQESINQLFTTVSTWLCHKHENQYLILFCYSCEVNICVKCWNSEQHKQHKERIVPFEEAFDHYKTKLKSSLTWINGRKTEVSLALNRVNQNTRENVSRLNKENEHFENLRLKSEAMVVRDVNPVTLMEVLETTRTIMEQRSSNPVKIELLLLDRLSDFIQEPTVLIFRMDRFFETLHFQKLCAAFQDAPFGGKWRCSITYRSNVNSIPSLPLENDNEEKEEKDKDGEDTNEDKLFVYLCLIKGKFGANSVLLKNASEKVHRFELNKDVKIGVFKPVANDEDIQEITLEVRQTHGDRIQQMQDYIVSLEEKIKPGVE